MTPLPKSVFAGAAFSLVAATVLAALFCAIGCQGRALHDKYGAAGASEARRDIALGHPRYLLIGELAPFEKEAVQLLSDRYGVAAERITDCVVAEDVRMRARGYNEVVNTHYGFTNSADVFQSAVNELRDKHKSQR